MSTAVLQHAAFAIAVGLFNSLWQGALLVCAVSAGLRFLPKIGAATRYAIWLFTLALIVLTAILPPSLLGSGAAFESAQGGPSGHAAAATHVSQANALEINTVPAQSPGSSDVPAPSPGKPLIPIPQRIVLAAALLWLLAACARGLLLLRNVCDLALICRSASLWSSAYEYPILVSSRVEIPLAVGFVHPAVVLPAALVRRLSPEALQAILIHEVAHLRRLDVWTNTFARIAEALLALAPATWFVMRKLSIEREIACDDWVVARGFAGRTFAETLALLASNGTACAPVAAPSAVGSRHSIVVRIEHLLDARPRRLHLSHAALGGASMVLALIVFTLQLVSPVLAFAPDDNVPVRGTYATTLSVACSQRDTGPKRRHQLGPRGPMMVSPSLDAAALQTIVARRPSTTTYRATIDADGHPHDITILHGSGNAAEDKRVVDEVRRSTFEPARHNCVAVAGTFASSVTRLPRPEVFTIMRPAVASARGSGFRTRSKASCRVPHHMPTATHFVKAALTPSMVRVLRTTNQTFVNTIDVRLDASGAVTSAAVQRSSGESAFDDAALAAIRRTAYSPQIANCSAVSSEFVVMTAFTARLEP